MNCMICGEAPMFDQDELCPECLDMMNFQNMTAVQVYRQRMKEAGPYGKRVATEAYMMVFKPLIANGYNSVTAQGMDSVYDLVQYAENKAFELYDAQQLIERMRTTLSEHYQDTLQAAYDNMEDMDAGYLNGMRDIMKSYGVDVDQAWDNFVENTGYDPTDYKEDTDE